MSGGDDVPFAPIEAYERTTARSVEKVEREAVARVARVSIDARTRSELQEHDGGRHDGDPIANDWNLGTILRTDPRWRDRLRFNEFSGEEEIRGDAGWRALVDVDDVNICRWIAGVYRLDYKPSSARDQVSSIAHETRVHPVREYLRSLVWDGVPRLDAWLTVAFSVPADVPVFSAVGRAWLISMVARVMDPGCKVDTVPILVGEQGAMKSSTLRALMPVGSWFCDSDLELRSKDKYQQLPGVWLYEIAEFDRFSSKSDAAEIKAHMSSQSDKFRASFARRAGNVPRQVVFAGSVNAREFLTDNTGSRRFWTLPIAACNPTAIAEARDQLWAEALHAYHRGESWWLSKDAALLMAAEGEVYRVADAWEAVVVPWLDDRIVPVTIYDILTTPLGLSAQHCDKPSQMRVAQILTRMGWHKVKGKASSPAWSKNR